jgi:hypothetical protein
MCADPGRGDLLVQRYRKRRVRKAETTEVRIGAPRKISPQKSRKIIPQITPIALRIARHNPFYDWPKGDPLV